MSEYRDIGSLQPIGLLTPYARTDVEVNTVRRGQVYEATHIGERTLPYMYRSFISFTYGGKKIEDFDLIATIGGDRLNRKGYAEFNDTVSTYDNLDGQHYWATHYKNNQLDFTLSTDGIDQRQLDNFLHWFKAGVSRELILAEHPNRGIIARVAQPPVLNLLPFEHDVEMMLSSSPYKTKTTLYKGDIQLSLTMDYPHWYAIVNILGKRIQGVDEEKDRFVDKWDDPFTGETDLDIGKSPDALKILYEDGIPLGSMIESNMLLGNGAYANVKDQLESCIWDPEEEHLLGRARIYGSVTGEEDPPSEYEIGAYIGIIAGAMVDASDEGITSFASNNEAYFYYAGTAPAPTIVSFTIQPEFNSQGFFRSINNKHTNNSVPYNTITIESTEEQKLQFTTPNFITSYNEALSIILDKFHEGAYIAAIRKEINSKVRHPAVRVWVNSLIGDEITVQQEATSEVIKDRMTQLFKNDNGEFMPMTFSFNSENGEAKCTFSYRFPDSELSFFSLIFESNALNKINTIRSTDSTLSDQGRYENLVTWGWAQYCKTLDPEEVVVPDPEDESTYTTAVQAFLTYYQYCVETGTSLTGIFRSIPTPLLLSQIQQTTEDVGDMLRSNNLIIRERNYPTSQGKVTAWSNRTEAGLTYSHRIKHDLIVPLINFQILYKNMYL